MDVLRGRLNTVEQEIVDLQSLLTIMRAIERDAAARERVRAAELGFSVNEVLAMTGDARRRAVAALQAVTGPTAAQAV